jgi:preprotein translocase subunit SecF
MELIKKGTSIDFVGRFKTAIVVSLVLILVSMATVLIQGGLNLGIDFAGGNLVQVQFKEPVATEKIRQALLPVGMDRSIIQTMGEDEVVIRLASDVSAKDVSSRMSAALETFFGKNFFEIRRVEYVGPKVGDDLRNKAILAILFSWVGMLIYITIRFEFRPALGAILALIHDVTITIGILSLLGREFSLVVVAALLTVIGYSINDTIVVFDRIRETRKKDPALDMGRIINTSINETLNRTIMTSLTTLLVVVILAVLGGAIIRDFALTLLIGIIVGTYSSIFVASPLILYFRKEGGEAKKRVTGTAYC